MANCLSLIFWCVVNACFKKAVITVMTSNNQLPATNKTTKLVHYHDYRVVQCSSQYIIFIDKNKSITVNGLMNR